MAKTFVKEARRLKYFILFTAPPLYQPQFCCQKGCRCGSESQSDKAEHTEAYVSI